MQVRNQFTTAEAAAYLGVTPGRIRHYLKDGILEGERHGRDWLIPVKSLEKFKRPTGRPGPKPRKRTK
jgi:excisionase family DNA binding protein